MVERARKIDSVPRKEQKEGEKELRRRLLQIVKEDLALSHRMDASKMSAKEIFKLLSGDYYGDRWRFVDPHSSIEGYHYIMSERAKEVRLLLETGCALHVLAGDENPQNFRLFVLNIDQEKNPEHLPRVRAAFCSFENMSEVEVDSAELLRALK